MRKQINVTQQDCTHGLSGDCNLCPVARAVGRAVKRMGLGVHVTTFKVTFFRTDTKSWPTIVGEVWLPEGVPARISDFDGGDGMKPFRFSLEVPTYVTITG
jgi:hypothetical protein